MFLFYSGKMSHIGIYRGAIVSDLYATLKKQQKLLFCHLLKERGGETTELFH